MVTVYYRINPAPIDNAMVEAKDILYGKPGKYRSIPYVSIGDVQLKKSDYTYKYYIGENELGKKSKISLGTDETEKTVRIVVTGKGNYSDATAEGEYKVIRIKADAVNLNKAKIVAKAKNSKGRDVKVGNQEYTGYAIKPEIRVMIKKGRKWTDVNPDYYTVSYINNLNKGKAVILITGNGSEAIGSKTVTFKITNMRISLFKLILQKITG